MKRQFVSGGRVKVAMWFGLAAIGLMVLAGCSNSGTKDPADAAQDRQDKLLNNPMSDPQMTDPNINGGGFGDYDNNAMKKDLDDIFN